MSKLNKISLLTSFLALWINSYFSDNLQIIIGFILIFAIGILHGSNDIVLINKTFFENRLSSTKIITYYILVVLFGTLLFCFIPIIGLLLFILFSSYHFGEQHWQFLKHKKYKNLIKIFQFVYGFTILMILFHSHELEVKNIIYAITNYSIISFNFNYILIVTICIIFFVGLSISLKIKEFKKNLILNIFYLIVFTIIFKTASLIWAFAIYFVIWHSLPSIKDQVIFIHGKISNLTIKKYILTALPFWFISLIGIFILYIILKDKIIFESLFFSFLAAITFPHVLIIIQMFKRKKTE